MGPTCAASWERERLAAPKDAKRRRLTVIVIAVAGVVVLAGLLGASLVSLKVDLPRPTGPHAVGVHHLAFGNAPAVAVAVYYPAVPGTGENARYVPAPIEAALAARELGALGYLPDVWERVHHHVRGGAAWAAGPFPLLVFAPGFDVQPEYYNSLLAEMASHGYVVAALGQPGITPLVAYPGGGFHATPSDTPPNDPDVAAARHEVRVNALALNISLVVDHLLGEPNVGVFLDGRVAAFGHSVGGAGAAEAALHDPRIRAVANMDGSLGSGARSTALERPVLLLEDEGPSDGDLERRGLDRERYDGLPERLGRQAFVDGGTPGTRIIVRGATHASFATDIGFLDAARPFADPTRPGPEALWRAVSESLLAFWETSV